MTLLRQAGGIVVALALAGTTLAIGSPANARSTSGAQAVAPISCLAQGLMTGGFAARRGPEARAPRWRRHGDTARVTATDLAALPAGETRRSVFAREVEPRLPATVVIPVYVHVLKGKHKGERRPISRTRAVQLLSILNKGMSGGQSPLSASTRYRFVLKKVDWTARDSWYHAFFNGRRDRQMKRKLHRGNARTLNLYFNGGGPRGYPALGWSKFPWQYAGAKKLDGVSVNVDALPGGRIRGYNLGDTLIHETGHWLGLLHTFQSGCEGQGDLVIDTPAEAEPSFACQTTRNTCPAPGLDPVRNFMDYSRDDCMNMFTPGQVRRMDTAFEKWRY